MRLSTTAGVALLLSLSTAGCLSFASGQSGYQVPKVDEGSTGKMHDANMESMVFAKVEIPRDGNQEVPLASEFRADEPIWARYYLSQSLAKSMASVPDSAIECKWEARRGVRFIAKIGEGKEFLYRTMHPGEKVWTFGTSSQPTGESAPLISEEMLLLPQERDEKGSPLLLALARLPDGRYPVSMRVEASCSAKRQTVASGEFAVVVDEAARAALRSRIEITQRADFAEADTLMAAARTAFEPDAKVVDFRVLETSWRMERGPLGEPIARHINVLTLHEQADVCTLVGSDLSEQHQGGGVYTNPVLRKHNDSRLSPLQVPCEIDVQR